ncbi:putative long-chain-alcohol O-fatty-acyltransferase 1 [Glycine soja]|uniref:Putative long-chain-alcohol O-fatty-acyltransferase 1 n=1 Tax=Glycine soja TaxID=3848 RepID=A0A445FQU5_GLYSO|nr:putative long-chain-alcohol O-fatty-acyltransferase 1 [Glycine soja]
MYGEIERFIKVWISAILGLCYCYYMAARIPKGFLRLLSLLPILYLFIILPLNISSPNLVGYTSFFLVQLGIFKLLLFSFNKGPLALSPPNIVHFISIASLPITPKQHPPTNKNNTTNTQKPKWLLPLKLLIFAMIARVYEYNEYFHPHFILVLYCLHLYLGLELVFALIATPVQTLFGLKIEPHFNKPYLSSPLQDFWGHRCNLMVRHGKKTHTGGYPPESFPTLTGIPDTRRVLDGYGDGIINFNPSGVGYGYGDMLGSRDKGLWRQYPYSPRPIAMSTYGFLSSTLYSIQPRKLYDYGFSGSLMCHVSCHVGHVPCVWACA